MTPMAHIEVTIKGEVLHLALNRPEKKNAITRGMYTILGAELNKAAADFAIRAVVLSGNGAAFTAGNDITDFMEVEVTMDSPVFYFLKALHDFPKPLIAAVHGNAVGIGTTALLHCDLVYVTCDASLAMPFVNLGLVPEAGSSLIFPKLVGHVKASEIFYTGRTISGVEAVELGIANCVEINPLEKALQMAALIASKPPTAVINTKALLKAKDHAAIEAVMQAEGEMFRIALQSDETQAAFMSFMSSRTKG